MLCGKDEKGEGFDDKHRGQLMIITGVKSLFHFFTLFFFLPLTHPSSLTLQGPMLLSGEELAATASQALGTELKFQDISECVLTIP